MDRTLIVSEPADAFLFERALPAPATSSWIGGELKVSDPDRASQSDDASWPHPALLDRLERRGRASAGPLPVQGAGPRGLTRVCSRARSWETVG